jgi:DNA-binding IclR family transcriptional regulator
MKSKFLFLLMCVVVSSFAQQPNTEAERMLQALKQSGMVRQEGNTLFLK